MDATFRRRRIAAPRGRFAGARRARGLAIVTVLLIVAVATTVVAGLFWREQVAIRSVENRLDLAQTRWIERAALDWAKVILRADQLTGGAVDHLGEPWALPVAETRLDETVTAGASIGDTSRPAMLVGGIVDAQARFDLNNLVFDEAGGAWLEAFRALLRALDLPESLADTLRVRLAQSYPPSPAPGVLPPPAALPAPLTLGDLAGVPGFDAATLARLAPHAVFLPRTAGGLPGAGSIHRINVNTASAEVLAAVGGIEPGVARQVVAWREGGRFFSAASEIGSRFGVPAVAESRLGVTSAFFVVRGVVRFDRVESSTETLLQRAPSGVVTVWQLRS